MKLLIGWLLGVMMSGIGCALFADPAAPSRKAKCRPARGRLYVEDLRREEGWM